jgi:putative DNA methylase
VTAGIISSGGGEVTLLKRDDLPDDYDPRTDVRPTVWEATQHLIKRLAKGEASAAALMAQLGDNADKARDLAYRLYSVCERKGWAEEARAYNGLIVAWPDIAELAAAEPQTQPGNPTQTKLNM